MTTLADARNAVYKRFIDYWDAGGSPISAYSLDNEQFDAPSDAPWVRLVVRNISGAQETLGRKTNRRYNRQAMIMATVAVPQNTGTDQVDDLSQQLRAIFEGEKFDGIYVNNALVTEGGNVGEWYQMNLDIFFFYEEIK